MITLIKSNIKRISLTLFILMILFGFGYLYHQSNMLKQDTQRLQCLQQDIKRTNEMIETLYNELKQLKEQQQQTPTQPLKPKVLRTDFSAHDSWEVIVTAYDLSVQSCGKTMDNPGYGVTASGMCLAGHTWDSARAIAVDPDIIPLGSQVMLVFNDEYASQFDGVYTAVDTGGDINGSRIDLFIGDFQSYEPADEAYTFGVRNATIYIL